MDPTTSFVLSLVAIIVSGISVVASFIAVGQTALYHPRPFMTARIAGRGNDTRSGFDFTVVNMGRASAHDVVLVLRNPSMELFERVWNELELGVTTPVTTLVSKVTGSSQLRMDPTTMDLLPPGTPRDMEITFELTWRQWPGMKRRRKMRWRVKTDAQANAFLLPGREVGYITSSFLAVTGGFADAWSEVWGSFRRMF